MYTFTIDLPANSHKQDLQCYADMRDGPMIPVTLVPVNYDLNETTTTETITVNWKTN